MIKFKIFLSGLILSGLFFNGFANTKTVDAKITKVTVYLNGAQITKNVVSTIPSGKSTLVLENLPNYLDANSIQASGKGSFTILAVNYVANSSAISKFPPEITQLQDSINALQDKIDYAQNKIVALTEEKNMILVNNKVDYSKLGFATEDLEDLSDFFRRRIGAILNNITDMNIASRKYQNQKQELQQQLNQLLKKHKELNSKIEIDVVANQATNANLEVAYYIHNAGWQPVYNIKSENLNQKVEVNYNAKVFQNSGEDWNNVLLTLSTVNPNLNNNKPILYPWRIDFILPQQFNGYAVDGDMPMRMIKSESLAADAENNLEPAGTAANFTEVQQNISSVAFEISVPYNIQTTGKPQMVNIQNLKLNADYMYYAAPKMFEGAYLIAKVTEWEDKNLLPGEANIYLQNTYIGKSFINPVNVTSDLDLSFGVDPQVIITRERIKDYCSSSFLGNNKKEQLGFEIKVKNTKNIPIKLKIEDQIPVAVNNEISVSIVEINSGLLNKDSGIITWEKPIQANGTDKIDLKFEVKYPKEKFINL